MQDIRFLPFPVNMEHPHQIDATIVWCFDPRMTEPLLYFVKVMKLRYYDLISLAGGANDLALPVMSSNRDALVDQVRKSVNLHGTKRIVLMMHSDCGALGGLASYGNDLEKEREDIVRRLYTTATNLEKELLDKTIAITPVFVDIDGFHFV